MAKAQTAKTRSTKTRPTASVRSPQEPGSKGIRLQLIIARAGIASRRQAEQLIRNGEVSVNGRIITELGSRADPLRDRIKVDGTLLSRAQRPQYYALNKPVGVVTTMSDPQRRPCVGDLAGRFAGRLYPVGRLDFYSSGLLILTNDGELTERLTHPSYHVEKRYLVKVSRIPGERAVARLRRGVRLEDGMTAPAHARVIRTTADKAWLDLRITEGRNRQVRRMCEKVGLRVEKLRRTAIGPLRLGKLAPGELRRLTADEVADLKYAVGLQAKRSKRASRS
ncbi:MAG: pseudouridine synthase [Candidatus Binatia bacterium]